MEAAPLAMATVKTRTEVTKTITSITMSGIPQQQET